MTTIKKTRKFNAVALALALSAGTVGGMFSFAAMIEPAMAASTNGGGGGQGGGGGSTGGGEPNGVMGAGNGPFALVAAPNKHPEVPQPYENCNGSRDGNDIQKCRYTQRKTAPRIVKINGFANCAVVQQVRGVDGTPGEFFCLKSM